MSATRTHFSLLQEKNEKANKAKQPYRVKGPHDDLTEEQLVQELKIEKVQDRLRIEKMKPKFNFDDLDKIKPKSNRDNQIFLKTGVTTDAKGKPFKIRQIQ